MFLGSMFMGDAISDAPSPGLDGIIEFNLSNAAFDDFFARNIKDKKDSEQIIPPSEWQVGVCLHAKFEGSIYAGNTDFGVDNTNRLLVKRRKKGEFKWLTLYDIPANNANDYLFTVQDPYAPSGKLEYAIVPIISGAEAQYSIAEIDYNFDGLMIIEDNSMVWTVTDVEISEQKNSQVGVYNTLQGKYPYVFYNGENDYYAGSVSATYIRIVDEPHRAFADTSEELHENYVKVMEMLNDRKPKILKYSDGRIRMIEVTTPPSDSSDEHYDKHTISFDYTEVGDPYSNEDMNDYGFLNVGTEWWVE